MRNPYLEDNFAPVRQEQTVTELRVTGTIPPELDGRYVRNGPNPAAEVDPAAYHWFTGDGMVHGVRLRDGRAEWYRNRWIRSPRVAALLGEPYTGGPATAPIDGLGANTNVIGHAGRTLALVEAGVVNYELTDELDTVGPCDFDGTLPGGYTAHPKRDPDTGELHAVSYFFGWGDQVRYSVIDAGGRARRTVDVRVAGSPMMHDFSLTGSHVVFYDLPVTFDAYPAVQVGMPPWLRAPARLVLSALAGRVRLPDPLAALAGRRIPANDRMPYRWNPDYPARVGVMPREGGAEDVRWFEIEPCYVFHPLNAYEDGETIVLEVIRHERVFDRNLYGASDSMPTLARWTIEAGKVREQTLDDRAQEFPRIDERRLGRRHRFGYSIGIAQVDGTPSDKVYRHDLTGGTTVARPLGRGREVGEFVFVPRSADSTEGDGLLMGYVYDAAADRSDLVLLDATTLETVAAVHLPVRVPHGFHGNWLPSVR